MLAAQLHPLTILALPLQLEQVLSKRLEEVEGKQAVSPCGCLSVRRAGLCVCVFTFFLCFFALFSPSLLHSFLPFLSIPCLKEQQRKREEQKAACSVHWPGTSQEL